MKTIYNPAYRRLINRLKNRRRELGFTQAQAGALLGRSRNWISKIELYELRGDVVQVMRMCQVYRLDATKLLQQLAMELDR